MHFNTKTIWDKMGSKCNSNCIFVVNYNINNNNNTNQIIKVMKDGTVAILGKII